MHAFFHAAAGATRDDLIRCLQYVLHENEVLRSRHGKRVRLSATEKRRLATAAKAMGRKWEMLISIAAPATLRNWRRGSPIDRLTGPRTGRPRTYTQIVALVLRMAEENEWGVTRIYAELGKLGLAGRISRTTVRNVLRENGHDPGPRTGVGTWDDFVRRHRSSLWAIDFLTKPILTPTGRRDAYVLVAKQVGSKRVWCSPATCAPWGGWVEQQARNLSMFIQQHGLAATHVISDRDPKFTQTFRDVLAADGITVVRIAPYTPQMNGQAEAFVGTIKRECLDHFITTSLPQVDHLVATYCRFYNSVRPHRALGNRPIGLPEPRPRHGDFGEADVECDAELSGLLRHYRWREAA